MKLTEKEYNQYLNLHPKLLHYAGKRMKKIPTSVDLDGFRNFVAEEKLSSRDALYENIHLIDDYIEENSSQLSEENIEIIRNFKHFKRGTFYVVSLTKIYALFLADKYVYGVTALSDPFEMFWSKNQLPVMIEAVLLPFKNKIIYDGIISSYAIHLGRGIRNSLKSEVSKSKGKFGVITTLSEQLNPSKLENSAENELLELMKTKTSREYNRYDIENLLEENPNLMPVYMREWGRINSRKKKKELKSLGIKKQHFALYNDTIIAADATLNNLKQKVRDLIPDNANQAAIFYFKM